MTAMMPLFGACCIGNSLGLYKKVALAEKRAGPRFVTSFVFFVSFALIVLTPYMKYPSLAAQLHELAGNDANLKNAESVYYQGSNRSIPLAFVFFLGLLAAVSAFSLCNAL